MKIMRTILAVCSILMLLMVTVGHFLPGKRFVPSVLANDKEAEANNARIFFVDIGQGAGTLVVSPTGRTLLVDGGPGGGGAKIGTLLDTLGIGTIDFTVVTHYHIDHISGITELLNAGRVAGTAFDNGDGVDVRPPNPGGTQTAYNNYIAATNRPGVTRQTIQPGQVLDLGGGMRATCIVVGGDYLSGASVPVSTNDINSQSIAILVEYNNFDYVVAGDLTGGGTTSTARGPDLETYVGQLIGDVDVFQVNHHGSTTSNNQRIFTSSKAETAFAQMGTSNTFGHPNQEIANRFLNTPATNGNSFTGIGQPTPGVAPVFYQTQASPTNDGRVSQQGYSGASASNAGRGTLMLSTDGLTNYSISSFDDSGVRISSTLHTYPVDTASPGVTSDFPPTVITTATPAVPLASESVTVSAQVNDRESPISTVTLNYRLNGTPQTPITMTPTGNGSFQGTIPAQPNGTRVDYTVNATAGSQTTSFAYGYFSGTTTVSSIKAATAKGEPLYFDYPARIQGVVTAGTGTFSRNGNNDDYVQDATGGINVFRTTQPSTPAVQPTALGQTVEVRGRIGIGEGEIRLEVTPPFDSPTTPFGVTVISTGSAPAPTPATIAQLNANPESFEGRLISISNATIVSGTIPAPPISLDATLTISDGSGMFTLKIDRDTTIPGLATPTGPFTVVGLIQQDDGLRPFAEFYSITPRSRADLGAADPAANPIPIADATVDAVENGTGTTPGDFIPDLVGQTVKVRGVVTTIDFRGTAGLQYFIQDATGGVSLFNTSNTAVLNIGDNVEVTGTVVQFNGLTQIDPGPSPGSITPLPPGTVPAVTPQTVTLSQLADGGVGEALEGRLIRVNNVVVTSGTIPPAGSDGNLTISDGTGTTTLRIDRDTNIDGTPTPAGTFTLTGVVSQFDTATPFDALYQILPSSTADIVANAATISASPTSVDFGMVTVGGSTNRTVTITNNGTMSATLTTPFTITGTDANQFTVGMPASTTIPPAGSTTVMVTFSPTSIGTKNAVLNITSASSGSVTVALTGMAQNSGLSVVPSTANFGTVSTGTSSNITLTITNNTAMSAMLTPPFAITGTNANQFTVGMPASSTIAPAGSTTVVVTFSPTTAGPKTAMLAITSSNAGSVNVTLNGTGQVNNVGTLPFSQNWSDTGLITANDNWTGVTGIIGYRGDNLTSLIAADPQTILADGTNTPVNVIANQSNPNGLATGGVAEFDGIPNPTVALNGSGTADAPFILISVNTTGASNVRVSYNLRDLDGSVDNAIQSIALQYRVGNTGNFINLPDGFVADATEGPNLSGKVTPVSVILPSAANNQPLVQVRMITTNANGNDEWVGIDDIMIAQDVVNQPSLSINSVSIAEGNSGTVNAVFTVSISAAPTMPVTVNFATANSTATAGSDYTAATGTLTFPVSSTASQTISVPVIGDLTFENNETFFVNLTNPVNATIGTAQGIGTITNDDPMPTISINDVAVMEGNSGVTNALFNVSLSNPSFQTITVMFATANGTAIAGTDYTAATGTLTFPANSTTPQTVTVPVIGDITFEPAETFFVNLSNPTNATIADNQGLGTIMNDDQDPGATANTTIYVADTGNNRIQRSTDNGLTWLAIGLGTGNTPGRFSSPRGVAASSDDMSIFVADTGNNRIQRTTDGGKSWQVLASFGAGTSNVNAPQDLTYDQVNDRLFVTDTGNNRIMVATGARMTAAPVFGVFAGATVGAGVGKFSRPAGIAVSATGVVYVADTGNNRIQVNSNGQATGWSIFAQSSFGTAIGKFNNPRSVFVDQFNNVAVADTMNNRIQIFRSSSSTWQEFMTNGTTIGSVRLPEGAKISGTGDVFVADTANNRIQKKPLAGGPASLVGSQGTGAGSFLQPTGIR